MCGGQPSLHKPRLVVSHSTCPPLSSSPNAHSFVLGTAVINNKQAPDPLIVGIRSPDGLVVGSCANHPGVVGSIPKREEPGVKTGRHPVLNYRVPHGSHWVWVWVWDGWRVWVSTSSSPPHPSHTLTQSLDSYCRPTAGKSSRPAGLSTLIYAYVVDCAPASPCVRYIWSSAPLFCFCKNK